MAGEVIEIRERMSQLSEVPNRFLLQGTVFSKPCGYEVVFTAPLIHY